MSISVQAGFGFAVLLAGWLMSRWASRYDVKSWITDAIWRFIFRQGWKKAGEVSIEAAIDSDGQLKQQIKEKADAFKSDAARMGQSRAVAKHGIMFAMAYAVNLIAGPIMIIALLVLAHAGWRWLA